MAPPRQQVAHLLLLFRLQAVVEIARGGQHRGRSLAHRTGLGVHQRLRAAAVEALAGHQGLQLRMRAAALRHHGLALRHQRVGQQRELGLLRAVQVQLAGHAVDHAFTPLGLVGLAHAGHAPRPVRPVRAGGEGADERGGAEHADQRAFDPGFHVDGSVG
jgi:hypothetical protein